MIIINCSTKSSHRIQIAIYRSISQGKGILQRQKLGIKISPFLFCKAGARSQLKWAILFRVSHSCNLRQRKDAQKRAFHDYFFDSMIVQPLKCVFCPIFCLYRKQYTSKSMKYTPRLGEIISKFRRVLGTSKPTTESKGGKNRPSLGKLQPGQIRSGHYYSNRVLHLVILTIFIM